ncbi:GNAT family N-acetyltransferase [Aquidulcibacter sp.]|uniref:GNAT family N-acetyltransferase n=1 Tax=Aquidulcibacter sp. TaxID=2052990 RepID=UPI0025C50741|nr:GNAT family N-acetyltransferase [Aquidulcibacter sp.]MCA3692628.1 GNAT family N-acetyltransferase [Aquidulcibacter sp.]
MIQYKINPPIPIEEIIRVYDSSGLKRPTNDFDRISQMYRNSNLVIAAYNEDHLIGVARSLTDFCYCCYLSDLAVQKEFQNMGIGKVLIEKTQEAIGPQTALILLSAPDAMSYYPKIGFSTIENGFIIKRSR